MVCMVNKVRTGRLTLRIDTDDVDFSQKRSLPRPSLLLPRQQHQPNQ